MISVSQRVVSRGRWWVDIKTKNTHLEEEEGRAEDTLGICVIRRSVSLATTGQQTAGPKGRNTERLTVVILDPF